MPLPPTLVQSLLATADDSYQADLRFPENPEVAELRHRERLLARLELARERWDDAVLDLAALAAELLSLIAEAEAVGISPGIDAAALRVPAPIEH